MHVLYPCPSGLRDIYFFNRDKSSSLSYWCLGQLTPFVRAFASHASNSSRICRRSPGLVFWRLLSARRLLSSIFSQTGIPPSPPLGPRDRAASAPRGEPSGARDKDIRRASRSIFAPATRDGDGPHPKRGTTVNPSCIHKGHGCGCIYEAHVLDTRIRTRVCIRHTPHDIRTINHTRAHLTNYSNT